MIPQAFIVEWSGKVGWPTPEQVEQDLIWGFLHAPGRLVHTARQLVVRILDGWPSADALIGAYERLAALC